MPKLDIFINEPYKPLYQKEIIDKYREIIYYGGRGGGKTYEFVQFFIIKALEEDCNILCLREFAKTNKNSVLEEFRQFIYNNDIISVLRKFYEEETEYKYNNKEEIVKIGATEIVFNKHNGRKSRIIFTGINDNTVMAIKSISNIKYCWVEEANFLSEFSYNILKPTIRLQGSKLFFTFNPQLREDFLYMKIQNKDELCYVNKVNYYHNKTLSRTMLRDIENDRKNLPEQLFLHIWEGEPLEINKAQVINTKLIGYFDDKVDIKYNEIIITCDTAYSVKESADYSVFSAFGKIGEEIHLLRLLRGKWEFNDLQKNLKDFYLNITNNFKPSPNFILIENKASGISLCQELKKQTHLPIKEVMPKKDKYTRVSSILSMISKLKLPLNKDNPYNYWINDFLQELRMFRSDLKHKHDDQVDVLCYALEYFKENKTDWNLIAGLLEN